MTICKSMGLLWTCLSEVDYCSVVGGGTAGLALAWKLALGSTASIAVVEAGSFYQIDNGNGSVIPAMIMQQHVGWDPADIAPMIDWDYVTEPQKHLDNRRLYYARGKTLGGCSARAHGSFMRLVHFYQHSSTLSIEDSNGNAHMPNLTDTEVRKVVTTSGQTKLKTPPTSMTSFCHISKNAALSRLQTKENVGLLTELSVTTLRLLTPPHLVLYKFPGLTGLYHLVHGQSEHWRL